jgi:TonB family protein
MFELRSDYAGRGWLAAKRLLFAAATVALVAGIAVPARAGDFQTKKSQAMPVYPKLAKDMKISGKVYLEVVIDPNGSVKELRPVTGNLLLTEAAEQAVRHWKFAPVPYEHVVVVSFNFTNP